MGYAVAKAVAQRRRGMVRWELIQEAGEFEWRAMEVDLTQREFDLAVVFLKTLVVLPREELMLRIWARDTEVDTRTVDTHASRLRKSWG
ncbi:MAG: winged helix-turn-helix domain-containing protein [Dechloromonas sp.]|uniref:Winged helix-turn-helix domain-containing protein n=1 Tax=Candidatus Dechloromonas phosphorivorans TaxID=2899244 RepID=A0A935JW16_9RHOO|nr:winged helix-turn-helix domain-containing protein [Candidatus Dechloromonas phosphorivorans]